MRELLRRRALDAELPEWDYEWDATKGLLQNNANGWTYTVVGATGYACTISGDHLQFRGSSSNYKVYSYPDHYSTGVLEVEINTYSSNCVMQVWLSDGTHGVAIHAQSASGIYLGTGTSGTKLAGWTKNVKYKVRLVMKPNLLGDVYVDDVIKASDVNISTNTYTETKILGRGTGSGNQYSYLYTLKMKFNRI